MLRVDKVFIEGSELDWMNIECPITREIAFAGYKIIDADHPNQKVILYKNDGSRKEICMFDFSRCLSSIQYVKAILIDGRRHDWIKEADGSAQRFRDLIN